MGPYHISPDLQIHPQTNYGATEKQTTDTGFSTLLKSAYQESSARSGSPAPFGGPPVQAPVSRGTPPPPLNRKSIIASYQNQAAEQNTINDWQKYRDDQLLSNPGGDQYYLKEKKIIKSPEDQKSFWGRLKKDLSDGFANLSNFFQNLFLGAKTHYRDPYGQIQEVKKGGILRSIGNFFKNMASALTFGHWHPDGETEPRGIVQRVKYAVSNIRQAVTGDLISGIGGSAVQMGEDLVLAGWNLTEMIPDATIGNFETGKKLTTTIFDNGQVVVDYLTDILPTGEAWLRVHSTRIEKFKTPVTYNLSLKERYLGDERWRYVRNTPFRKTIETIGSLLADVATLNILNIPHFSSENQNEH